ncbi:unnamed protein product [Heterosigma akashiwo]
MTIFSKAVFVSTLLAGAQAFVPASAPRTSLKLQAGEPEVLTESTLRQYLGDQGLRYNLNKTDKEIETEGDYNIFQKIIGATSNNDARLALKKEARLKAGKPNAEQASRAAEWLEKYGYARYFPAYMDKAKEDPVDVVDQEKTQKKSMFAAFGGKPDEKTMMVAKNNPSTPDKPRFPSFGKKAAPAEKAAPKPKPSGRPTASGRPKVGPK